MYDVDGDLGVSRPRHWNDGIERRCSKQEAQLLLKKLRDCATRKPTKDCSNFVDVSCIISEILDVEMTTKTEMTFKCLSRSSKVAPVES